MSGLAIGEVADRTGLAPGTIRMWEQRYGFPTPERTASGFRRYAEEDVEVLRRALALREQGMSVAAALARARSAGETPTDRPSIYGALVASEIAPIRPLPLRKRTLLAISRAIENEVLARAAAPVCFGAFQHERFYRRVEHRYRRIAEGATAVGVFADFDHSGAPPGAPVELVIGPEDALGNEWAVIVDAPGYAACLIAWEQPARAAANGDDAARRFEALWTLDPRTVRHSAEVAAALAARCQPEWAERVQTELAERPLAFERPAPGLISLTNRIVEYLDGS